MSAPLECGERAETSGKRRGDRDAFAAAAHAGIGPKHSLGRSVALRIARTSAEVFKPPASRSTSRP